MISIQKAEKKYGSFSAVSPLSLSIKKGEILGFLGPNGAGKTTTMKMITSFLSPSEGKIHINGLDTVHDSLETRKKIGYLPENNPLYPELTIEEFLSFCADLKNISGEQKKQRMEYVVKACQLKEKQKDLISTLSKGWKQRVGLAQALLSDPEILILDEPTIGLDPNQVSDFRKLIKDVSENKTIIFCSHILSEVEAICNRIVIINQGKVVSEGTIDEITAMQKGKSSLSIRVSKGTKKFEEKMNSLGEVLLDKNVVDGVGYIISVDAKDIKKLKSDLLEEILSSKIELLEFKEKTISLEDVFRDATKKNEVIKT